MRNKNLVMKRISLVTGFTIVELIVVIAIIGVLSTIVGLSYKNWQTSIVTAQLKSDLNGVASSMENARTFGNAYPSSVPATFEASEGVTLNGGSTDGGETYCVSATSSRDTSLLYHIDSSSGVNGAEQGVCGLTGLVASAISTSEINLSWSAFEGATSYTLQEDDNSSFTHPTDIATQSGTAFTSSGLSISTTYYYRVNAVIGGNSTSWSNIASATTNSIAPSAPTVSYNTITTTTTWSWTTPSCPVGDTARYQYKYTITPAGYDSGWVAIASSPVAFTTSVSMETYTVEVQAQCFNTNSVSDWSASGSAAYYRSVQVLTTIAVTGGTVSEGGTFTSGSTQTITATPDDYYDFVSWTGSTGCSGAASHTITMDEDKTCTANFTYTNTGDIYYYLRTLATGDTTIATTYANIDLEMDVKTGNQVISADTSWGNATADTRMLGVRVEGNLTIDAGVTLTATTRKRGMAIYVTGDLILNGTISMTARGATAAGQQVLLLNDGTEYQLTAVGGAAGDYGAVGGSGSGRQTGGGGGGGGNINCMSSAGAAGTSYSGGAAGGSNGATNWQDGVACTYTQTSGGANGGAGGNGGYGNHGGGGGGAGNNGGTGRSTGGGAGNNGANGTGGLLILYVGGNSTFGASGLISSNGSKGGDGIGCGGGGCGGGGGGSGGGSVNVFYKGTLTGYVAGKLTANAGAVGTGGSGGAGGAGTTNITQSNR